MAEKELRTTEIDPIEMHGDVKVEQTNKLESKVFDIGNYMMSKVLKPMFDDMLIRAGHALIDAIFDNGRGSRSWDRDRRSYEGSRSRRRTEYASHYRKGRVYDDDDYDDYDDYTIGGGKTKIKFTFKSDAMKTLDRCSDIIERNGYLTIADLRHMLRNRINMESRRDDDEWGWYDISTSRVSPAFDGYYLILPRPERIDD